MAPPPAKRQRKVLSLETKKEILCKCDAGWSNASIQDHYGIAKSTLGDIKRSREKIMAYSVEFSCASLTARNKERKVMAKPKSVELDQCVMKWYQQQRGSGVMVRGTEMKMAAERFAAKIGIDGFKASEATFISLFEKCSIRVELNGSVTSACLSVCMSSNVFVT